MISCRLLTLEGEILRIRDEIDLTIGKIPGVKFLVSCVTGTVYNNNAAVSAEDEAERKAIRKGK